MTQAELMNALYATCCDWARRYPRSFPLGGPAPIADEIGKHHPELRPGSPDLSPEGVEKVKSRRRKSSLL